MAISNVFEEKSVQGLLTRLDKLTPNSKAKWGKMNAGQMLRHLNVPYDMAYTDQYPVAKGLKRWLITLLAKNVVVSDKPYKQNSRTAKEFLVTDEQDFEKQKKTLVDYITRVQKDGRTHFEGKESTSFGNLTANEWNNLFGKHLDHHFDQFGI